MFKTNEGMFDRALRIIIGLALIAGFFLTSGPWSWLFLFGIIPLATGILGWRGLYTLFGINTCKMKT